MKKCGRVQLEFSAFLTSALGGGGGQLDAPDALPLAGWASEPVWTL